MKIKSFLGYASAIMFLLFFNVVPTTQLSAQTPATDEPVYILREFMKVEPDMGDDYLKVEKVAKKVHQRRVDEGKIIGWDLFRRVFNGTNADYDYMVVTRFKNGKDLEEASKMSWEYITKGMSAADLALANNINKTRRMTSSSLSVMLNNALTTRESHFIKLTQVKAASGKGSELEKMETMMKPVFEEAIKKGDISAWRFGRNLYPMKAGGANYYRVITTTTLDEMLKADNNAVNYIETAFKKVYPNKDWATTNKSFSDIITILDMDLFESVDSTSPAKK